jgi:FKBP-type peptidyl-prolyl cis-trans isomerase 2
MADVKSGDRVKVHYTGRLTDGTEFDSSRDREPLVVTIDAGQVIPGFNEGLKGMKVGDEKTVNIAAPDAYGERSDEQTMKVPIEQLPTDPPLSIGMTLVGNDPNGGQFQVTLVEINEETATLDGNHTLAGKELIFDLELLEIMD